MKSLLGKNFSDPEVQEEIKKLPFKIVPLEDDHIGIEVNYDGKTVFSLPNTSLPSSSTTAVNWPKKPTRPPERPMLLSL